MEKDARTFMTGFRRSWWSRLEYKNNQLEDFRIKNEYVSWGLLDLKWNEI